MERMPFWKQRSWLNRSIPTDRFQTSLFRQESSRFYLQPENICWASATLLTSYFFGFSSISPLGISQNLSPGTSPSNGLLSSGYHRSPVEFPDTADFLTKPSVNVHKSLGSPFNFSDCQQQFRTSSCYTCNR